MKDEIKENDINTGYLFLNHENSKRHHIVENFYKQNHIHQTLDWVLKQKQILKDRLEKKEVKMTIWEVIEKLENFIDGSDPDTENDQTSTYLLKLSSQLTNC